MGLAIEKERFEPEEYAAFAERLQRSIEALATLLDRPGFGEGETTLGAELELALVGDDARPMPINLEVLGETLDPRLTVELDRFNLECNLRHGALRGRPFAALGREIRGALDEVGRAASLHACRAVAIGILPTLTEADLQSNAMTNTPRFKALSAALTALRREPFALCIDGADPLEISCDDVTFEGAATSLQIHLRVAPRRFSRVFNAIQLATAPALALAGNSPTFLGHRLWEETRVALFKQAVDGRGSTAKQSLHEARVSFGRDWVQRGALELFRDAVERHEILLPVTSQEDPLECLAAGGVPRLDEVRLHQGTIWGWNRPVYDSAAGGHLRIELRALPAGPSLPDMLANIAFLVGLGLGLAEEMDEIRARFDFELAHGNFYRAAKQGLAARLDWPHSDAAGAGGELCARDLIARLLPVARAGLECAGVDSSEVDDLLAVIDARRASGQTGAAWQRAALSTLGSRFDPQQSLAAMLERYIAHARSGRPVHEWSVDA